MTAIFTQLVSEEPVLLAVGSGSQVEVQLWSALRRQGAVVTELPLTQFLQNNTQKSTQCEAAYKIVCVVQPKKMSEVDFLALERSIAPYEQKTVLVVLLDTAVQFMAHESAQITSWRVSSDAQERAVEYLSKKLTRVRFIFCVDLCDTTSVGDLPAWRSLLADPTEVLDPQVLLSPVSVESFVGIASQELIKPLPQPSQLVRGTQVSSTQVIELTKHALAQLSMRTIATRKITAKVRPTLPFSITETVVIPQVSFTSRLAQVLAQIIPPLPQPKKVPITSRMSPDVPATPLQVGFQPPRSQVTMMDLPKEEEKTTVETQFVKKQVNAVPQENTAVDVSAELQKIFTPDRVNEAVARVVKIAKTEKTVKKKSKRKTILYHGGMMAIFLGIFVFILVGTYTLSVRMLQNSIQALLTTSITAQQLGVSKNSDSITTISISPTLTRFVAAQQKAYGGLFESKLTSDANLYVEIAKLLPKAVVELKTAQQATKALYSFVIGNQIGELELLSKQLTTASQNSYEQLSELQALLKTVQTSNAVSSSEAGIAKSAGGSLDEKVSFQDALLEIRKTLVVQQQLQSVLPALLGKPTKRVYAIAFQNDQELRPTGGFIQSIALVTFAQGGLVSTEVVSSYELDQKLLGEVQPPKEVQQYLGEKQWYLRDSNWDPHFPNSAAKIAWFIDKTKGVQVDGVIALNTKSLEEILSAIGPVDVPEFNEVITDRNLSERMEFHSEVLLAPDTKQRDYTTVLFEKVLRKVREVPEESILPLLSTIEKTLSEHELLITTFPDGESEVFAGLGWDGGIVRPNCPSQFTQKTCMIDYFYAVEANVGVNKANAYISRSATHDVELQDGVVKHTHVLRLENTARSNSWPKGTYKNFMRFYLPSDSVVESVSINGSELTQESFVKYQEQGFLVVGVEILVSIQEQSEIELLYTVPAPPLSPLSYAFFWQKQPGVTDTPVVIRVKTPEDSVVSRVAPAADIQAHMIEFTEKQSEHLFVGIELE